MVTPRSGDWNLRAQTDAFLADLEGEFLVSPATCQAYQTDCLRFLSFLERTLNRPPTLLDFNTPSVAQFLAAETALGHKASTVLRRRSSLARCFRFLQKANPDWSSHFRLPSSEEIIQRAGTPAVTAGPATLDPIEVERLWTTLVAARTPRARRDHAILAILIELGLSVSDLVQLNLKDLDIRKNKARLVLRGRYPHWVFLGPAAVPVQRYLSDGRPELNRHPEEPALFLNQSGKRLTRQRIWQALRRWGRQAGIETPLSPRLVRNTAAAQLKATGKPLPEIQALLGHRSRLSTQALLQRLDFRSNETLETS